MEHEMDGEAMNMVITDNNAYLMAMGEGSRVEIHAVDREKESWTQLETNASAGSDQLVVQDSTGWEVGDKIAIASGSANWTHNMPTTAKLGHMTMAKLATTFSSGTLSCALRCRYSAGM